MFRSHFGHALELLKRGERLTREGWNGRGMWIALWSPGDANDLRGLAGACTMTLPFLYMRTAQGDLVPWLASQTDLLASDWTLAT